MEPKKPISHFSELIAWKKAHALTLSIYECTRTYPDTEKYGLVSQMRRCSVSIGSNIAEGFGRRSWPDKRRFYDIAVGSMYELENQVILSIDLGYISKDTGLEIIDHILVTGKLTRGLIKSVR